MGRKCSWAGQHGGLDQRPDSLSECPAAHQAGCVTRGSRPLPLTEETCHNVAKKGRACLASFLIARDPASAIGTETFQGEECMNE